MQHTHHGQNAVPTFTVKVLKFSIHLGLGGLIRTWNFDLQFHKQTLLDFLDANPNLISRKLIANLFTCNWESLCKVPPFTPLLIHIHPTNQHGIKAPLPAPVPQQGSRHKSETRPVALHASWTPKPLVEWFQPTHLKNIATVDLDHETPRIGVNIKDV